MEEKQFRLHKTASLIAASIVSNKKMVDYIFDNTKVPAPEVSEDSDEDIGLWKNQAIAQYSYELALCLIDEGEKDEYKYI